MSQPRPAYLVLSRRELLTALRTMDHNRLAGDMEMSNCVILEGTVAPAKLPGCPPSPKLQFKLESTRLP